MDQGAIPHTRTSPTLPATEKPAAPRGKHGLPAPPPRRALARPHAAGIRRSEEPPAGQR